MRFMLMRKTKPGSEVTIKPDKEQLAKVNRLIHEMLGAGVLIAADGFLPSSAGARVTIADGKRSVTEGPFKDSVETVDAFALIEAGSKGEAIEWGARVAAAHAASTVDILQVAEMSNFGPLAARPGREPGPANP